MSAAALLLALSATFPLAVPEGALPQEGAAHAADQPAAGPWLEQALPGLVEVYQELHRNPELSFQESNTATALGDILEGLGFDVTRGIGGLGVAGLLHNGPGPVLLLRCDMDGLPIEEATGLDYASHARAINEDGSETAVMHACGHDMHMTVWTGAATFLARHQELWSGTLLCVAQPAEERGAGAREMLADGLYARTASPDFTLALHVTEQLPAGRIGYRPGYALANVDSVDITVHGRGGHGSRPHVTHDPVALAARIVMGLQTIVSREVKPIEAAVVTVGSIHGGSKHNIIPDEVRLQLTVRSYTPEVRELLLRGIERVARFEARAAGFPAELEPEVRVREAEFTPSTWNDPALTERVVDVFSDALGADALVEVEPSMGGEDFGRYAPAADCPGFIFWLGTTEPGLWRASRRPGAPPLPGIHSAGFAPDAPASIRTGVVAMTAAALDLLSPLR